MLDDFWLQTFASTLVGLIVGLASIFVSSAILEPRSVKRDRRLRHIDHLLTEVYGPIQYSLKRAQSRAFGLDSRLVKFNFAFYISEAKALTETFQTEWGLMSPDVQKAWLDFCAKDNYGHLEHLATQPAATQPQQVGYVTATTAEIQPLLDKVDVEIIRLRQEYDKSSGISVEGT